ncbi:MAG: tyrosine-type recombinase/integrase [Chlamydiota bacterium]
MEQTRTSTKKKAKELAKYLTKERPDYPYLKRLFKDLRKELDITVTNKPKKLPYVPTEQEVKRYYEVVWNAKNFQDMIIIKTFLYTGVRVSELVNIKISDIDLNAFQIRIIEGKGKKDRIVPFSQSFREMLAMHIDKMRKDGAKYLFESNRRKKYTDRAIRQILHKYSSKAKLNRALFPHALRHFLFTWLKKQGIDDALIQPYSGHDSRKSLEVYSKLSIPEAQQGYNEAMKKFPL